MNPPATKRKQCLSELRKTPQRTRNLHARTEAIPNRQHQTGRKSWRLMPGPKPSLNSAPRKRPWAGALGWAGSSQHVFRMAATCTMREIALGHGGQCGPNCCPTPANSHELSTQINGGQGSPKGPESSLDRPVLRGLECFLARCMSRPLGKCTETTRPTWEPWHSEAFPEQSCWRGFGRVSASNFSACCGAVVWG